MSEEKNIDELDEKEEDLGVDETETPSVDEEIVDDNDLDEDIGDE